MHVGREVPNVTLKTRVRDESVEGPNPFRWQDVATHDIFAGKRIVIFGLPGAFTPTCSSKQLPGFEGNYETYKTLGVDDTYCVSVNDAFVMYQWGQHQGLKNVKLLPDGNGDFTRRLGMLIDKRHLGFGLRSWRYAAVIDNGRIAAWFEEPGINDAGTDTDPYEQSTPENVLAWLEANPKPDFSAVEDQKLAA
ncbi:peroxiredoxin [Sphingomonas sp. SUN039]|uniref:peroxiredoxin n=1 Tax=Sphingomonas sp. SUN039 TaxID=2937787 RepID=UPI002164A383|nr:peroxiredoxin [Sphingomonas sp. SUN039]UVO52939.1 peroxiredoxin [Sphingomonas sp. SUN039]